MERGGWEWGRGDWELLFYGGVVDDYWGFGGVDYWLVVLPPSSLYNESSGWFANGVRREYIFVRSLRGLWGFLAFFRGDAYTFSGSLWTLFYTVQ